MSTLKLPEKAEPLRAYLEELIATGAAEIILREDGRILLRFLSGRKLVFLLNDKGFQRTRLRKRGSPVVSRSAESLPD